MPLKIFVWAEYLWQEAFIGLSGSASSEALPLTLQDFSTVHVKY